MTDNPRVNENDRSIIGLTTIAHAVVHTYELSLPILATIWYTEFGISAATTGVVLSAGYALFGLGALPGGMLADTYGSRRLIVVCLLGMSLAFFALGLAPGIVAVALALLVWGMAASIYHPSGLTLISKGISDRGSAFAFHGMAGNLGIAIGPLATTLLLGFFGWRIVVELLAVPALLGALYAARVEIDETTAVVDDGGGETHVAGDRSSLSEVLTDSKALFTGAFAVVFSIVVFSGLYYRGLLTFLPVLLDDFQSLAPIVFRGRTINSGRYVYAGLLGVGVVGQYVGGRLTDRIPTATGLSLAFAALAVLALLFVPATTMGLLPLLVVGAVLGFMLFFTQPFYQAAVAEHTPAGLRGLSYGYTYLGTFGVGALGGALAGLFLTYASSAVLFTVLAGVAAVAAGLTFVFRRQRPAATTTRHELATIPAGQSSNDRFCGDAKRPSQDAS